MTYDNYLLLKFISDRTNSGDKTTVADICDRFPSRFKLNAKESNFSNCPKLYEAVDEINSDTTVHQIIVKDNNNFHLATEEEAKHYCSVIKSRAVKQFKKYWEIQRKINRDGNGDLATIGKDFAIDFINSFVEEENVDNQ